MRNQAASIDPATITRVRGLLDREATTRRLSFLTALGALVVLCGLAAALLNTFWIKTFTSAVIIAIASSGLAMLYGQLGIISLCKFALIGLGGWVELRIGNGLSAS